MGYGAEAFFGDNSDEGERLSTAYRLIDISIGGILVVGGVYIFIEIPISIMAMCVVIPLGCLSILRGIVGCK